jgi:quinoprotein glucose dehydrogenase
MKFLLILIASALLIFAAESGDWPNYGNDAGGQRFSPLTGINKSNVKSLKVAWTFRTGDAYSPASGAKATQFEATPLYVDGTLFIGTPLGRIIALEPTTGKQLWAYDAQIDRDKGYGDFANRGVSTWKSTEGKRRIYIATIDARLIAVDATTGKLCLDFGDNGSIDLRKGLRLKPHGFADYEETSPPAIAGNTIVVGSGIADNGWTDEPSGEVRGFDVVTGHLKWTWDPIPQTAGDPGSWPNGSAARTGAANAWSVIAVDSARNLVYVPTGSASPDYYGGERPGDNLFANSVVALQAETGKAVWHFQTVHHDLWDYDVATPPLLFDMHREGKTIPAIAIGSKTANLFILNRETGEPIFGVEERPVPKSETPGEVSSPTQPFPIKPLPLSKQGMTAEDAFGIDDADREYCRAEISKLQTGVFIPPSLQGTLQLPGNVGGQNWGGMTYDPVHDLLIVPANNLASEVRLLTRDDFNSLRNSHDRKLDGDWELAPQHGTPYGMMRRFLLSPKRIPCTPPPWGTLVAISASTGEKKWEHPLGQFSPKLPAHLGSLSLGGPISTAGGLIFTGGTLVPYLYAFDVETGEELWKGDLPTSAKAVPMTFLGPNGKQYVVVAAGGFGISDLSPLGDSLVAFSL